MKKEYLISDIKDRFHLGREDFQDLQPYEISLIYKTYPKLSKDYIYKAIKEYAHGKLILKRIKKHQNSDRLFEKESYGRGVFKSSNVR